MTDVLISLWFLAALFFVVRLACSTFSSKVSAQIRRYPAAHFFWGLSIFLLFFLVSVVGLNPSLWPPVSWDRRNQRQEVAKRVQKAGGWDRIHQACVSLTQLNTNGSYSYWHGTNGLPAALATLNPVLVEYLPENGFVQIRIFGIHQTGGHSSPYFGLEVDTSTNSLNHMHGLGRENGGMSGNTHRTYKKVAEGIFEVY